MAVVCDLVDGGGEAVLFEEPPAGEAWGAWEEEEEEEAGVGVEEATGLVREERVVGVGTIEFIVVVDAEFDGGRKVRPIEVIGVSPKSQLASVKVVP
jgi:hypothetical protein